MFFYVKYTIIGVINKRIEFIETFSGVIYPLKGDKKLEVKTPKKDDFGLSF